jgi:putative ABC transport system permease protein
MRRAGTGLPPPRLTARDTAAEAVAGIVQRPGRAVLTMLGTILGVGAFVAVLGLTATGAGQISRQFTVLEDTTVTAAETARPTTSPRQAPIPPSASRPTPTRSPAASTG